MSGNELTSNRLIPPLNHKRDHILGPKNAPIRLMEYGSYDCPHCRAANERIIELRDKFGDKMQYAFRHRPVTGSILARRAAELVECAKTSEAFWKAHVTLMTRSQTLTEDDLRDVAQQLDLDEKDVEQPREAAKRRVEEDTKSARKSGVRFTPSFFINERRYDGPWDENSFAEAMHGSLGHRVRVAALSFASWAQSTGILLLLTSLLAILLMNSPAAENFAAFWETRLGLQFGSHGFAMSLLHWVNDGLLTIFFLVVGLEIKREFTVGSLAGRKSAAFPIAAALGGMLVPALFYMAALPNSPWTHGWGIPIATDTAFAIALIAMMGRRVPVGLRIFLTASAIVDDIGAIIVVAVFYSGAIEWTYLVAGLGICALLWCLNKASVYRVAPYILLGIVLWVCILSGGLHPTLAGVVLATFIPTRPPPNFRALATQADSILRNEADHSDEQFRSGPSRPALQALDAIHDRLESPADRMLRLMGPRSSYVVLPIFALANAGVTLNLTSFMGHQSLLFAILAGLVLGKPAGYLLFSWLAVRLNLATKPDTYSWGQLVGAGALAGIGFTMSLFIAGQSFPAAEDFAAAKIAVFVASILSGLIGVALLWNAKTPQDASQKKVKYR